MSREGALDHRESRERRDKIFAEKTENAKIFKKKLDQEQLGHIQACPTRFLAQKMFVILRKKCGQIESFSWGDQLDSVIRQYCTVVQVLCYVVYTHELR